VDGATIRPATSGDVPALSELAKRTWSETFGDSVSPDDAAVELEATRSETYFLDALRDKVILVGEEGGVLLGYVQFGEVEIPEVDVRPGDQGLHRLYVDGPAQGRGLGKRLTDAALRHPRLAEAKRVFLTVWGQNDRAMSLYASFGFETVGSTTFMIGAEVVEDLVMLLDRSAASPAT
jgi:diamine N-acetyltransferase